MLGSLTRPLTQNLYAYCGNNPLNYIDPSGHDWWSDLGDGLSNAWSQVTNWAENTSQQIGNWFDARTQEASHYLTEKIDQAKEKITAVKCMDWKSFSRGLVYELLYNTSTTIMSPVDMLITISGVNLPTFRELVQDDYLISGDPYMYYLGKVTGDVIALAIGVAATVKGVLGTIAGVTGGALLSVPSLGTSVVIGGATVAVSITEAAAGGILVANSAAALSTNLNHLSFYEKMRETSSTGKGDSDSNKNKIPDNDSITGHIFRDAEGHIPDTPENRALLEDVANDSANFRGTDKYGNEWYTKIQSDGSQVWVESRNGNIFEGGINNTPKPWNPETGLKKP